MEFLLFILIVGLGVSGVSKVSYDLKAVKSKERQYDHKILHIRFLVLRNAHNASAFMNINSSQIPESKTCVYVQYR